MRPIDVRPLFPETLDALLDLLHALSPGEWRRPTACASWSVHDVALHLLGGDMSLLSRSRDGYHVGTIQASTWRELVTALNARNAAWVQTTRVMSPRLVCDLVRVTGERVNAYFDTLDLEAVGGPVSWAGPDPAPVWLDVAREYTERWHHQQHIRDAVGRPGLTGPRYLTSVLNTFVQALPRVLATADAPNGTAVTLHVRDDVDTTWTLRRDAQAWVLLMGEPDAPDAKVILSADAAWRMFTKGIDRESAREQAVVTGNLALASRIFDAVALIA